jgi:hypothetical protein
MYPTETQPQVSVLTHVYLIQTNKHSFRIILSSLATSKRLFVFRLFHCGISRKDKIRNTVIEQKINVEMSLLYDIETKQLQWYGHVQRMEEGRLSKEDMKWRLPGRRKRGRPKLTWAEGIRGLMGET